MNSTKLGIVGLSASDHSWAGKAHITGLRQLENSPFTITGLLNTSVASSEKSIEKHQLDNCKGYSSIDELAASDVDAVVVAVKVPHHYEMIKPALEAGKDVLCEWPLGNDAKEAQELATLAREKNLKAGVVLQSRKAPTIVKAKELVESGAIGQVISANMVGVSFIMGQYFPKGFQEYLFQNKNNANLLTIVGGHDLDAFAYVLGEFESLNGLVKQQFNESLEVEFGQDGKQKLNGNKIPRDVVDQILVQGVLKSGATASVHLRGAQPTELNEGLRWEIHGTRGEIVITSDSAFTGMSQLKIKIAQLDEDGNQLPVKDISVDYDFMGGNLKYVYDSFGKAKKHTFVEPQLGKVDGFVTFDDAVIRHRQLEAIIKSSRDGTREKYC
ncbi:NAD(P)-binding protein [Backusella circina FSU 941]|nr:NAD(P)-binding protein [Backusella circina FSU 941]